jgi:hypothetical protein
LQLHVDHIEPAAELEADLLEMTDFLELEFRVKLNAGSLICVNSRDNDAVFQGAGAGNQFLEEQRANAESLVLVVNVDGIFDGASIG